MLRVWQLHTALALLLCAAALCQAQQDEDCEPSLCLSKSEFKELYCNTTCDIVRTVFKAGKYGRCCPTYKCIPNPKDKCCGVTCPEDALEQATADCNVLKKDPVLNSLDLRVGARYAFVNQKVDKAAGLCCPQFGCKTNQTLRCENVVAKTPCLDPATSCPKCHSPRIISTADPEAGTCCDEFECVPEEQCLCDSNGESCPMPSCMEPIETVTITKPANPSEQRCCPEYSCTVNQTAYCNEQRSRADFTGPSCASECDMPVVKQAANFDNGKCFPQFECVPNPSKGACCGFNTSTCAPAPNCEALLGPCHYRVTQPANEELGECCDQHQCLLDKECLCSTASAFCETKATFQARKCPNPVDLVTFEELNWYMVVVKTPADFVNGRCCPEFECAHTPEGEYAGSGDELLDL